MTPANSRRETSMGLLQGKVAIVTGGSSGIGRAIARAFAAEGAAIVVADTRTDPLEGVGPPADLIAEQGGIGIAIPTDVANWDAVDRLVGRTVDRFGRLDVLVNNAAVYTS